MSEWQTFTGSPEQFLALSEARRGVIVKGMCEPVPMTDLQELTAYFRKHGTFEFLICNPNPLEDMICQQARTGQPVWVRIELPNCKDFLRPTYPEDVLIGIGTPTVVIVTNKPNWNIPGAQYSFTPFEE